MKFNKSIFVLFFSLAICIFTARIVFAGPPPTAIAPITITDTDTNDRQFQLNSIFYFFDLRERETFIQLTYPDSDSTGLNSLAHIQIFDVGNNCNENDFFDNYTINDTHVYNMRDIQTNDGNPSGVILPNGAYGIVAVVMLAVDGSDGLPFGNQRIVDNNGYEYRTNAQTIGGQFTDVSNFPQRFYSFNFNQQAGITLSDVVGITVVRFIENDMVNWDASNPFDAFVSYDIDIIDNNETLFSCRDVIYACVDQENPLLEELLEFAGTASVASFEYGINEAIPHSMGGELLCPGNNISEGITILRPEQVAFDNSSSAIPFFLGYIGLNNGNGRGSMDSFWYFNFNVPVSPG